VIELPSRRKKRQADARPKIFDPAEVAKTLGIIRAPTDVFEIRALNAQLKGDRFPGTVFGYFDSADACIAELGRIQSADGIYITLNPVVPALLARANNRLKYARKGDATTSDKDIVQRRRLLIDVDSERPPGISATDLEKEAAMRTAGTILAFLRERDWPDPVIADSGNGAHLLYPVDLPCDDEKLLEQVLYALADRFDGDGAKLDRTVHNPARIVRLYGTLAAKGDHLADRPHRLSTITDAHESLEVVRPDLLRPLVKELQPPPAQPKQTRTRTTNEKPSKEDIRSMLASIPGRLDHDPWTNIIAAVADALPDSEAIEVLQERWPEEKEGEYAFKLKHRKSDIHVGTLIHLAKEHGWTPEQDKIILPEDGAIEIAKPIITPDDVIKGILHRGEKAALGGATKTYKTWNFIDIGVAVATGSVCLDNRETVKGKVLYANFEIPRPFFWKRVQTVCDARQITLESQMFETHHLRGRLRDWLLIEKQIEPEKYSLIILDPSYKLLLLQNEFLREENSSGVVSTLVDRFEQLAARSGAAILFGSHFSKGDQSRKESIDRISGSGVWIRDADSVITFTELETPDCYAVEMTLRNHPRVKKFAMRWEFPLFVPDISLDPSQLKKSKGAAEPQYQPEQLLEVLTEPMFTSQWEAAAIDKFKMSESTFKRLRWKLVAMDAVVKPDRKWLRNEKWRPNQR
jgi:hypothetical protein